ncbi:MULTISPECIES: DUF7373 family lipoprotein [unclassified Corynebacterium]|uniref:DUF7373 family lipoprotein n=1 Tax=unclassified Corynebacterium TaxID=2624378 RepID=UPI0030A8F3A1
MKTMRATAALATVCSLTLLAGCDLPGGANLFGNNKDKETETSTPAAQKPSEQKKEFDTGDWPTEPAKPFGKTSDETIIEYETARLLEHVVLPFEVDPKVSDVNPMPNPLFSAGALNAVIDEQSAELAENNNFLYGSRISASIPKAQATDGEKTINTHVLRFLSPEDAQKFAEQVHQHLTTTGVTFLPDDPLDPSTPITIPELANSFASTHEMSLLDDGSDTTESINVFVPHDEYVLYFWADAPAGNTEWLTTMATEAVNQQKPRIDQFQAVKTVDGVGEIEGPFELDKEKLRIYALPSKREEGKHSFAGVFGPRGVAANSYGAQETLTLLNDAGATHTAVDESSVTRASNEFAAQQLWSGHISHMLNMGWEVYDEPQGVPDTKCVTKQTTLGQRNNCFILKDNYVGETYGEDQKELTKATAAQYMILQKAESGKK